jgi:hypothetical protein
MDFSSRSVPIEGLQPLYIQEGRKKAAPMGPEEMVRT